MKLREFLFSEFFLKNLIGVKRIKIVSKSKKGPACEEAEKSPIHLIIRKLVL
jgi:hypothetical protein